MKKKSKAKSYQLRDLRGVLVGTFTQDEIFHQIATGQLTGSEEISGRPFNRWQQVASHPVFYDAFMKRLLGDEFKSDSPSVEAEQPSLSRMPDPQPSVRQQPTRRADIDDEKRGGMGPTAHAKTEFMDGATVQDSDLRELFSESLDKGGTEKVSALEDKTAKLGVDATEGRSQLIPIDVPPEPTGAIPPPPRPKVGTSLGNATKIRIAGIALLLAGLFYLALPSSTPTPLPVKVTQETESSDNSEPLGDREKADRIKSLSEEGEDYFRLDLPPAYQQAQEIYREALTLNETNADLLARVAEATVRMIPQSGNEEALEKQAREWVEKGRAIDPHYSAFYRVDALLSLNHKNLDQAAKDLASAVETNPGDPDNAVVRAELEMAKGNTLGGKLSLTEAIEKNPKNVRARLLLARAVLSENEVEQAQRLAMESLSVNPLSPTAYWILGEVALKTGQFSQAKQHFESCRNLSLFATPEIAGSAFFELGKMFEKLGETNDALQSFRLAYFYDATLPGVKDKVSGLSLEPLELKKLAAEVAYSREALQARGDQFFEQGKFVEAGKFFLAASLTDRKDGLALVRLGETIENTARSFVDFQRVINLYQRAIQRDPTLVTGYVKLGLLETAQYNFDRAQKLLGQAYALAPNDPAPCVALGKHFYERKDFAQSLVYFKKAYDISKSSSEISYYVGLLRLQYKKESADTALKLFYQAYVYDSQNYDALAEWLKMKVVLYEKNFAIKYARNLSERDPANPKLYWVLGEIYTASKEYRRAVQYYEKALGLDRRSGKIRMSLAKSYEAVGELGKAINEYKTAASVDPRSSEGLFRAGEILFQFQKYDEAENFLNSLVAITPNYPGARRVLARISVAKQKKDKAIEFMKAEVKTNPHNAKYRLDLADIYMGYERYDDAIQELKTIANLPSVTEKPEYVYDKIRAYLLLSRCFRAQNKADSAEGAIKLALEIDPNDPQLHREFGYVLYALQRDKEGVREFQLYLQREPAAKDAEAIRGLIDKMRIEE